MLQGRRRYIMVVHVSVLALLDRLCKYHHDLKTYKGWGLVAGKGKRAFVAPEDPRHPRHGLTGQTGLGQPTAPPTPLPGTTPAPARGPTPGEPRPAPSRAAPSQDHPRLL